MSDEDDRAIEALERRLAELRANKAAEPSAADRSPKPPSGRDPKSTKIMIAAGVIAVLFVGWVARSAMEADDRNKRAAAANQHPAGATPMTAAERAEIRAQMEATRSPWRYRDDRDPMTDALTRWACTTSSNQAVLGWPYGDVDAELCLRQSPRYGLDAFVSLRGDGQILCRSYDGCTIRVRFGEGSQQSFSAASAADGSSNVIFIQNAQRFVNATKNAEVTRIQLTFYQAGDQVLEFATRDLEWPRPLPSASAP